MASEMIEMASENQHPSVVSGRQTPISQRRPLQRLNLNAVVLSPTKRRRQSNGHDDPASTPQVAEAKIVAAATLFKVGRKQLSSRWTADDPEASQVLLDIFGWLGVKNLVADAAPACRLFREVAHSKELWAMLRSHLRLVDQLLVTEKVVERRSKGRLFKCRRLGSGEAVLLRMVDLELTNAGKDDGVPTSFLREAALLKKLRHPHVIRHFGSEILGKRAVMCTEYIHESFTTWYKRLEAKGNHEKLLDIKVKFGQMLAGLSHVHHQGVMHRNLKPDNIFIDEDGVVKLGDFTTTRMLDIPFQAYTPEDPKERDRSGREMRRLWYRAPELILRDEIYGPKVDVWSVGCLLAEAASGRALFQSDSEIDHLFRVFRLVGTPTATSWPEVMTMKNFSPKFPVYAPFSLAQVSRAACGSTADRESLASQAHLDREDILQNLLRVAAVLGPEGMFVLDRLVATPPSARAGVDATLQTSFFRTPSAFATGAGAQELAESQVAVQRWLQGAEAAAGAVPGDAPGGGAADGAVTPRPSAAEEAGAARPSGLDSSGASYPPVSIPSSLIPARMVWSILHMMQRCERSHDGAAAGLGDGGTSAGRIGAPPRLPPGLESSQRSVLADFVVNLASTLSLTDYTLHLAIRVVDSYLAQQEEPMQADKLQVLGATCLKIADVFTEQSKEYYKQENAVEYAEATYHQTTSEQMLLCEKEVLPKLDFDLHLPTAHWFAQCYLAYGRFTPGGNVAKTACFIGDLALLDYDLLAYPPSLRAQCTVVLAVFLAQQARSQRGAAAKPSPRPSAELAVPPLPTFGGSAEETGRAGESSGAGGMVATSSTASGTAPVSRSASMKVDEAAEALSLTYLEHWDTQVRNCVCRGNSAVDAAMCMQALVRTLSVLRREWKALKLTAVEAKHASLSRTLVYPERFPVSKLVRYILPDTQRGMMLE